MLFHLSSFIFKQPHVAGVCSQIGQCMSTFQKGLCYAGPRAVGQELDAEVTFLGLLTLDNWLASLSHQFLCLLLTGGERTAKWTSRTVKDCPPLRKENPPLPTRFRLTGWHRTGPRTCSKSACFPNFHSVDVACFLLFGSVSEIIWWMYSISFSPPGLLGLGLCKLLLDFISLRSST